MVLESSWGRFDGPLVTSDEVENVERVLKRLEDLLPLSTVRASVGSFYKGANERVRRAAYAEIEARLADDDDAHELGELRSAVESGPDIEGESVVARAEIVRYWVNTLLEAWSALREAENLPLNAALLPPKRDSAAWMAWDEHRRDDLESLLASVALDRDAVGRLTEAFRNSAIAAGSIELPSNLRLVWSQGACALRSR